MREIKERLCDRLMAGCCVGIAISVGGGDGDRCVFPLRLVIIQVVHD